MLALKLLKETLEARELTLSLFSRDRELGKEACDEIDPRRCSLSTLDVTMGEIPLDEIGAHLSSRRPLAPRKERDAPARSV